MKETNHKYKGFEIIGTQYEKEGSEIFHTGYFRESSFHRNYNIKKDGKYVVNPYYIFEKLKHAKEEVDRILSKNKID